MTESMDSTGSGHGYVIDAENAAEMARLMHQDQLLTQELGGLVTEPIDLSAVFQVLDIACGSGGWLLDLAATYPHLRGVGIDISQLMTDYANSLATSKGLSNVEFQVMDATKPLDFPDNSFDLVNARILTGFLSTQQWPALVQECYRIARPGGVVRLTEVEWGITNSAAYDTMTGWAAFGNAQAGHSFSPHGRVFGTTPMLKHFLRRAGLQNVQHRAYAVDYSAGATAYEANVQNYLIFYKLFQDFLVQMNVATRDVVQQVYQQMEREMQAEDFCALDLYVTAWGYKGAS